MNDLTSNSSEMNRLNALKHIKRVEVRESLYADISAAVHSARIIPLAKLRAAAAVLLCLISLEVYVVSQTKVKTASDSVETLVPITQNSIYHE
ncbi:MAG: hypothetical protein AB8B53_10615 [Flavobacteriales bacterium]